MIDDELTDNEHRALDAWTSLAAPADFADRVMTARANAPAARAKWPFVAAAVAAAAAAILFVSLRQPSHTFSGDLVAGEARTTRVLGDRAVAVAEPGASLSWRIDDDGDAVIDQREGDVFYRVDRGGPFVVHTPAGDVHVTGTCFRIEVPTSMNKTKQILLSGTVGAAIAAGVIVTVYEGHVIADSKRGPRTEVAAGNRATMSGDGPTIVASAATPSSFDQQTATREQLIAQTSVQRNEIMKLRSRVAQLEKPSGGGARRDDAAEEGRAWYDPSPERLAAWAGECRVRADEPNFDTSKPERSLDSNARGIEPSELAKVAEAFAEVQGQWKALVKQLYIEATGDVAGGESLSLDAMRSEIEQKSDRADYSGLLQRIAMERAGQAQPPVDVSKASPLERMFRAHINLGDQTEQAIAKRLGPERAKAIRGDGWDSRSNWSGCPE